MSFIRFVNESSSDDIYIEPWAILRLFLAVPIVNMINLDDLINKFG